MNTPTPRRWFRFSLRTFFVVLTIFGVWLGVQVKWVRDRKEAIKWLTADVDPQRAIILDFFHDDDEGSRAPFPLNLFGETGVDDISLTSPESKQRVHELRRLFPETNIE